MYKQIQILDGTIEDARTIGHIQTQTWLNNYPNAQHRITKEDIQQRINLAKHDIEDRLRAVISTPGAKTWVAKDRGSVIGFVGILQSESGHKIEAIHVLPSYQGQGIGTRLLTAAMDFIGDDQEVSLDVVSYNDQAIHMYQKFGFVVTDKVSEDIITLPSGKVIPKIVMVRPPKKD
jgi:ribosomal protein S18 acetylase RimI-like enzyme